MKILVTGGAGFIGSHLVDHLIEMGHDVFIVDNFSTGKRDQINPKARYRQVDVSDNNLLLHEIFLLEKIEFVYHLAAAARIPWCTGNLYRSHQININSTISLLELAKQFKVRGFVFASSSSIYGDVMKGELIEESHRVAPKSVYGLQKYASEQYVTYYSQHSHVPGVSLRFFNVYGTSRQSADGPYPNVFTSFYKDKKEKGRISIFGSGEQKRDFVHVYDVVSALSKFSEDTSLKLAGQAFNVGTGIATSVNKVASFFNCPIDYLPARAEDPMWSCADNRLLQEETSWLPKYTIKKGAEIFFNSFK